MVGKAEREEMQDYQICIHTGKPSVEAEQDNYILQQDCRAGGAPRRKIAVNNMVKEAYRMRRERAL